MEWQTSSAQEPGEMERIAARIRAAVECARRDHGGEDEYKGLYISDREVDALLAREAYAPDTLAPRLEKLRRAFGLTDFDVDALLICLAPDIDVRHLRLYAYLQDDITRQRPTVNFILDLLCSSPGARHAARLRLSPEGPLVRHGLVALIADPAHIRPPLLGMYACADEGIAEYVLGSDEPDSRLVSFARVVHPQASLEEVLLPAGLTQRLKRAAEDDRLLLYLQGAYGAGKRLAAEALCRERAADLLLVDCARLAALEPSEFQRIARLAVRESVLRDSVPCFQRFDALLGDEKQVVRDALLEIVAGCSGLALLTGEAAWQPCEGLRVPRFARVELPSPGYPERLQLWGKAVEGRCAPGALEDVANKFRLSGGQIRDAAATAQDRAAWRDPACAEISAADLHEACRLHSNAKLSSLARKIAPQHGWADIVLPADRLAQLREIANQVKFRSLVYEAWGFGRKLSLGKGLNILFAGPSGTGKTLAAEIIAGDLGLDLYKIDLSAVVSKYIGETEKNLSRIFAEAETSNAILFFDEADALFGKRSEVRDSHDRYANIEIGYLLQRMEEHEGVVILASNFRKNMDDAFVRRMHFTVEMPFPEEQDRRRIWEQVWPETSPRSPDMDLDLMARRFEITGGNIRNIAVAAAFLAAADGGVVNMAHLLGATRREYQKMGKVVVAAEGI